MKPNQVKWWDRSERGEKPRVILFWIAWKKLSKENVATNEKKIIICTYQMPGSNVRLIISLDSNLWPILKQNETIVQNKKISFMHFMYLYHDSVENERSEWTENQNGKTNHEEEKIVWEESSE